MKHLVLAVAASLALLPSQAPVTNDTLVLLVRHAEKAGPSGDVPLSAAGEARAQALVPIARAARISAVITTQFQRTRQTGAPAAAALGLTPETVSAAADAQEHARQVAERILSHHRGASVLVVGHSNTVPAIIAALGGPPIRDLCDSEYDRLFTVVVSQDGTARVVASRYGDPSPADSACAAMH